MKTFEPGQTVFAYHFPREEVVEAVVSDIKGRNKNILAVTYADKTTGELWAPGTFLTAAEAQAFADEQLAFAKRITKGRIQ